MTAAMPQSAGAICGIPKIEWPGEAIESGLTGNDYQSTGLSVSVFSEENAVNSNNLGRVVNIVEDTEGSHTQAIPRLDT